MKVFRNYFWQFLGPVIGILAIFAVYHVYTLGRPSKLLNIIVENPVPLIQVEPEASQDIEVYYKGDKVTELILIKISLKNVGNQPIQVSDFYKNPILTLPENIQIIDISLVKTIPSKVEMSTKIVNKNQIEFLPTLINKDDLLIFNVIGVGEYNGDIVDEIDIAGRIIGVKSVNIKTPKEMPIRFILIISILIGAFASMLASIFTNKIIARPLILITDFLRIKLQLLLIKKLLL